MTCNLLFCYPDILLDGTFTQFSTTPETGYSDENIVTGPRSAQYRSDADANTITITIDLGSGNSSSVEYLLMARADIAKAQGMTGFRCGGNGVGSGFTYTLGTSSSAQSASYDGTRSEDLIITESYNDDIGTHTDTAHRYWEIKISSPGNYPLQFSKIYMGDFFDLGSDPEYPMQLLDDQIDISARRSAMRFELTWTGITNAKRTDFIEKIGSKIAENPVFLYTQNYHDYLNDARLIHCMIETFRFQTITVDNNNLSVTFEELI